MLYTNEDNPEQNSFTTKSSTSDLKTILIKSAENVKSTFKTYYYAYKEKHMTTVYWDVDDVILNSLETAVDIINKNFRRVVGLEDKTVDDVKDWKMKSIYKPLTCYDLENIFSSDEFWQNVTVKDDFRKLLNDNGKKILKNFNHVIVTKGCDKNLSKKEKFIRENIPEFEDIKFIGISHSMSKSSINMQGGIFIDDNIDNLYDSDAEIKILLKNNRDSGYNNGFGEHVDIIADGSCGNLYIVRDLRDVQDVLNFYADNEI